MNNKILITIIIGVCMVAAAGIIAFGMMNSHDTIVINSTNGTNNATNHTNITNNTNVEHTNNNDVQHEQSETPSTNNDDGFNHYTDDNGNAMVGNPNGQHMSESQHQQVLANGMA